MAGIFNDYKAFIAGEVPEIFYVPETIGGEPVTEIGPRAFYGCREISRIILPKTVERIGAYAFAECRGLERFVFPDTVAAIGDYAFYNCMALKEITLGRSLCAIGYGAFKNCLELSKISMVISPGKKNCLNSILQDEFQEVDVTISYVDEAGKCVSEARLVFTDYQYEYVPEIEARQFNWETYGSGDSYRISIRDTDIDYGKYDSVFPVAMVEDDEATLFKIVAGRLCRPHKLLPESRERYEAYVAENMPRILEQIFGAGAAEAQSEQLFRYILEHRLLKEKDISLALDLAQRCQKTHMTAMLMDFIGKPKQVKEQDIYARFAL